MTREEAIKELKEYEDGLDLEYATPFDKAILYAIKALEQEPTTKNCRTCKNFGSHHGICEICKDNKCWTEIESTTKNDLGVDCISRQAVIDLMMQKWGENFSGDDAMQESIDAIRELPSVTPQEPKTGHWIPRNSFLLQYKCSECGLESEKYNYCPNCGSRNEVEE